MTMRLTLLLDPLQLRRWHLGLAAALSALPGTVVAIETRAGAQPPPAGIEALFQLEAALHGLSRQGPAAPVQAGELAGFAARDGAPPELVIDLCGAAPPDAAGIWQLSFDGVAGEAALLALLLAGATPLVALRAADGIVAAGRPGTEYGGVLLASYEDVTARIVTLIVAAVAGRGRPRLPALPGEPVSQPVPALPQAAAMAKIAAKKLAGTLARRIYHLCCHAPHWRTGWRRLDGPDLYDLRRHPEGGWRDLADDGTRFFADPFPILHEGRLTLFLEDYEHRLGKGIISAVAFGDDGPIGAPVPVLERPGHLSYPFVFARDGAVWMIPESGSAGTIDLFRATAFPGGWVHEATLVEGVVASDATLVEHGGLWWIFATVRDGGGAFSDALHLWSAPDFRGPFAPHPGNPVLIDIASARPAGRMVTRGGALLRPVQDCRRGYGAALAIARVTRLDASGFEQEVETLLGPGPLWPGRRLHTLNSAGGFEFIDGSGFARRRLFG